MRHRRVSAFFALFVVLCGAVVGVRAVTTTDRAAAVTGSFTGALISVEQGAGQNVEPGYYRFTNITANKAAAGGIVMTFSGDTNGNAQDYTLAIAPPTGQSFTSLGSWQARKTASAEFAQVNFVANGATECAENFGDLLIRSYTQDGAGNPLSIAFDVHQSCSGGATRPLAGGWVAWSHPYGPLDNPPTGDYVPLANPARLLDTRTNGGAIPGGGTRSINASDVGVPSDAIAVVANLTAVAPTTTGYLSLFPTGGAVPTVSNVNFSPGDIVPNLAVVRLGTATGLTVLNSQGSTHVVLDVMGYYRPSAPNGRFSSVSPLRVLDTRKTGDPLAGGVPRVLTLADGAIGSGVSAVVVNVTVTGPTSTGYLTVHPAGETAPTASNLNFRAGQTIPNLVVARTGSGANANAIALLLSSGQAHVVVDVVGVFNAGDGTNKGRFIAITPKRAIDSRAFGLGIKGGGASQYIGVIGWMSGFPFEFGAVVANVTVTNTTANGYLTVFPAGQVPPTGSNLNWVAGETRANMTMSGMNPDGFLQAFNSAGDTDWIIDVFGWYTP